MKKIYIMLMFCLLLSACQSGKQKIINVKAHMDYDSLASALKVKSLSYDFQFSKPSSSGEWSVFFLFFNKGKLIIEDKKNYDPNFDSNLFGGCIGTPKVKWSEETNRSIFIPDDTIKFNEVNIRLFFIDLEYVNLNENVLNKKHYKAFLTITTNDGRLGFSNGMFVPKAVIDLSGHEFGVFPENFKHPERFIPLFYLRNTNIMFGHNITEMPKPSTKSNPELKSFITANHHKTLMICFLVKTDTHAYLNFCDDFR
jgi:hypothetical protein